jgi:hypothetical protein
MPGINRAFPHLLKPDIEVWQRFLDAHQSEYDYFDYDVRVGIGQDPGDRLPENLRQMGIELSKRRIDAIGYTANTITIIEITRDAGLTSIGQLTAYPVLYRQTFPTTRKILPLLVAETLKPDVQPALEAAQIPWLLFPAPTGQQAT